MSPTLLCVNIKFGSENQIKIRKSDCESNRTFSNKNIFALVCIWLLKHGYKIKQLKQSGLITSECLCSGMKMPEKDLTTLRQDGKAAEQKFVIHCHEQIPTCSEYKEYLFDQSVQSLKRG